MSYLRGTNPSCLGICLTCGYTTQVKAGAGSCCPGGHGELREVSDKLTKLINRKGRTGQERLAVYKALVGYKYHNRSTYSRKPRWEEH